MPGFLARPAVMATRAPQGACLCHVEGLALGDALGDIVKHHVSKPPLRDEFSQRGAHVSCADNRYFRHQ
jgi:hypothetical protein